MFDVVVCTKNSGLTLDACLKALKRSDVPIGHIIIIDKNSMDETRSIAFKHGCIYLSATFNVALARRIGAKICSTEYFINLDSDIAIPENFYSMLKPHITRNFITKGIYFNQLTTKDRKVALRDLNWMKHNVGGFDCCFIHRKTFLEITEDWEDKDIGAVEDTVIYQRCEKQGLPVHQDHKVISKHYVHSLLRVIRRTSDYASGSRKGEVNGRFSIFRGKFLPLEMLAFPLLGFIEMLMWRSWRLLFYETAKMMYWFKGYFLG